MKFWSDVLLCDSMMIHLECQSCRDMHAFSLPFRALSCLSRLSKHHRNLLKYGQSVKRNQTKDDRKNWSWTQNKSRLHFPAASMLFHVPTLHTELLLKSIEKKNGMYTNRCKFSATQTAIFCHLSKKKNPSILQCGGIKFLRNFSSNPCPLCTSTHSPAVGHWIVPYVTRQARYPSILPSEFDQISSANTRMPNACRNRHTGNC